jgi:hypothetical protein
MKTLIGVKRNNKFMRKIILERLPKMSGQQKLGEST